MLLNGSALNSTPLNGVGGPVAVPVIPAVPIAQGLAFRWRLRVLVGGVDMSARLTGSVAVDRERGAAGVASFVLQLAAGPVLPSEWVGRTVEVYYLSTAQGVTTESRRYTGRIVKTEWSSQLRQLACQCGDQLQQRVEALEVAQIDALTPEAFWSTDVFDAVAGRSRWDYAQERLSSIPASLDCATDGTLRLSSWYAGSPAFVFGTNTTIYDSMSVSYADLTSLTNTVEIEADYRFSRLWQQNIGYSWLHPLGSGDFCLWRTFDSNETPDVSMVVAAAEAGGLTVLDGATYSRLPPTGVYCFPAAAWINNFPDLLLGADFVGARRWTQTVTEQYRLSVTATASVAAAGPVIARDRLALEVENERGTLWDSEPFTAGTNSLEDLRDESRRATAVQCVLNQAATKIIAAHTATTVSWDAPTSMVMDVDLPHTLSLDDQGVKALGCCARVLDSYDLSVGTAITTLAMSVMRGGGEVSDPLSVPAGSVRSPLAAADVVVLPSQFGGRPESPAYNDALDGFAGNYAPPSAGVTPFDRRFILTVPELAADLRDDYPVPIAVTYRLAIPNDLLEL